MWRATNSGVSSNMWMKPCSSRRMSLGRWRRGLGLAVDVDRHIEVLAAHFLDEVAQVQHRRVQVRAGRELLVVDRQDEGAGAALLLGELRQVAVAGDAQHLEAFGLDGLRQRADAQAGGVLGAEVFVDDDDGKAEFHGEASSRARPKKIETGAKCKDIKIGRCLALRLHTLLAQNVAVAIHSEGDCTWLNRPSGGCWPVPPWPLELLTGTFYLLMLAIGLAAAALAAHLGAGTDGADRGRGRGRRRCGGGLAPASAASAAEPAPPAPTATSIWTSAKPCRSTPGTPMAPPASSTAAPTGPSIAATGQPRRSTGAAPRRRSGRQPPGGRQSLNRPAHGTNL